MSKIKITKQRWFKPVLILIGFIVLAVILSRLIIFSHPEPLRMYLEFLDKHTQRTEDISVFTKQEFAEKYLGTNATNYKAENFPQLFQEYFNYPPVKENELFKVYQIANEEDRCQVKILGVGQKRDLVYVSFQNICVKNDKNNK
jgi:hypothetical protein